MHALQMLAKKIFAIKKSFTVGTCRKIAAPVPELEVDMVDVTFPLVFGGK